MIAADARALVALRQRRACFTRDFNRAASARRARLLAASGHDAAFAAMLARGL